MSIRLTRTRGVFVAGGLAAAILLGGCGSAHNGSSAGTDDVQLADVSEGATGVDIMFAQMMIPHHEQAVVMAELAVDRAEDPQIVALASEIRAAQDPEIDLMASWLEQWGVPRLSGDDAMSAHGSHGMAGMLSDSQLEALAGAQGTTFDALFATYMIEHHRGAISMAEDVVNAGSHPAVAALARDIIVSQEKEILQLQGFLSGEGTGASVQISPALSHVHAAVVDGNQLLVGTHDGVHAVDPISGVSSRVGASRDDLMAFAGDPSRILAASGHPGPNSTMGNPLGLVTSSDGGTTWQAVSLQGEVDFHSLTVRGSEIVAWDTRGPLQWSTDAGATWQPGPTIVATSIAWFQDRVFVASPEMGLSSWIPGKPELESLARPSVLLAAADGGDALWRIDGDGSVYRTADGAAWTEQGRVTQAEALAATSDAAYVMTGRSVELIEAA
jgi:uncharacterized protein (DUF305 family)